MRLPVFFSLLGAARCKEECAAGEICFNEDETSMVQGFRTMDVAHRDDGASNSGAPQQDKHSVNNLMETAGNMLKNGATPDVVSFTVEIVDDIAATVEPAIERASIADQALLRGLWDQFGVAAQELEAAIDSIALLASESGDHRDDHVSCRNDEAEKCEEKKRCDYDLYALWEGFLDEEEGMRQAEATFRAHFCADLDGDGIIDVNGTTHDFRELSVTKMSPFIGDHPLWTGVERAEQAYDDKLPICERKFASLDQQTALCNRKQLDWEGGVCQHATAVWTARDDFAVAWNEALIAYDQTVAEVKQMEFDRVQEWRALTVVRCLLNRVSERNGRPCDESTDELQGEMTVCEQARTTANITWLYLDYPVVPAPPVLPVIPAYPCDHGGFQSEYASLPTVPEPVFTEINSHCNPRPDCEACTPLESETVATLCTAMSTLSTHALCGLVD